MNHQEIDRLNEKLWKNRYSRPSFNYSEGINILQKAEKTGYERGIAYARLNMATACFFLSENRQAFELVSQLTEYFYGNSSEPGYVWTLNLQASLFESLGDYEKGLTLALRARKNAEEKGDKESESDSASILGLIYTRLSNYEKALEHYNAAGKIREELSDRAGVASTFNRLGMIYRLMGEYAKALDQYEKSREIRQAVEMKDALPWTMLGIASTYEDMGRLKHALDFYKKGLKESDKRCGLQCIMGCGRIYSKTGDTVKAGKTLLKALKMAEELKAAALIADIYLSLSLNYESQNNPAKALEAYKNYQSTKEAVLNEKTQSRFRNVEISHAIEKSEHEKEIFRLRNVELKAAYDLIEEKNRDILASINYASRIQSALLPDPSEIEGLKDNLFILFLPKDIVSGDFYWFSEDKGKLVIAAGDCTGHGVPGSLMSMLGISFLEEIVNNREITDSGAILDELRKEIQRALRQKGEKEEARDGMDIALCVIDQGKKTIQYSGAYNNLYLIRNGTLTEYPADRMPIGIYDYSDKHFSGTLIDTLPGDTIYLFSDGFADQFGGPDNKKFKYSAFKNLILKINMHILPTQKELLEKEFMNWKGTNTQTDDVVVIAYRHQGN